MEPSGPFKKCRNCGVTWNSLDDFMEGTGLRLIGYQVSCSHLSTGIFLFNHSCGNTLSIWAKAFEALYDGPIFQDCFWEGGECPAYCLYRKEGSACPSMCECAFVNEITQIIRGKQAKTE